MYCTHYIPSVLICICTINKDYYNVHVYQFLAKRVRRSVKTVHTKVLAKKCKLHKFATTNNNFEKIDYLRHASS